MWGVVNINMELRPSELHNLNTGMHGRLKIILAYEDVLRTNRSDMEVN